jgi:hypothetical protein
MCTETPVDSPLLLAEFGAKLELFLHILDNFDT